jgi:hypothetical protein
MNFLCKYCNISFKRNCELVRHSSSIKCKEKQNKFNLNMELNNNLLKIEKELEHYKLKFVEKENKIQELTQENNNLKIEVCVLKTEIKTLEKSTNEYRNIVEKAATKSTNTINKNYQHNNYLNYISSEPIQFSNLKNQLKNIVTSKSVMYDDEDFHNHIVDNIFKDKNGKDKILCTDINRKNFTYKDETSGELISDPELEKLRDELKKGTDIREIRKDLLEKLVTEYEKNGYTGSDPYKQFSEIIQKLNFGSPFVEHIAKKTYVKRCPTLKRKCNLIDINSVGDIEVNDVFENETEYNEEYQKLYEEFKDKL